jgi:hypothetical protein
MSIGKLEFVLNSHKFQVVSLGIFSVVSDNPMCPGSTQLLNDEYLDQCVRLTTYHLQVRMSQNLKSLPSGSHRPVM